MSGNPVSPLVCCCHLVLVSFRMHPLATYCTSHKVQGHRPASLFPNSSQKKIYRSKYFLWRIKIKRVVSQVYSVFIFGCEGWSGSPQALNRIKEWETNTNRKFYRHKKGRRDVGCVLHEDGKIGEGRLANTQLVLPEVIAECLWKACWLGVPNSPCDQFVHCVLCKCASRGHRFAWYAAVGFHRECLIFCFPPIFSFHCSPLRSSIDRSATSPSPHICTIVPSQRTEIVLSSGPTFRGAFPSLSALTCSPFFYPCTTGCFTFIKAQVTTSFSCPFCSCVVSSFRSSPSPPAPSDADVSHTQCYFHWCSHLLPLLRSTFMLRAFVFLH